MLINFIAAHPVLSLIMFVALLLLTGWVTGGGLEDFHSSLSSAVGDATGATSIAERISDPFGG